MAIVDDTPQTRRRFLVAISSVEPPQLCYSEHPRVRTQQKPRRDESGGAKDARTGRRGENAVARKCDGATWSEIGAVVTALFA